MEGQIDYVAKILLIGDSSVGKTAIINQLVTATFSSDLVPTVGIDFFEYDKELSDGKKIRLNVWDSAGQEKFRSITSSLFRSAAGIFLVFDITKKETFDHLPMWLKDINTYSPPNCEVIIVGNKTDLESKREVPREMAMEMAKKNKLEYMEVTSKSREDILNLFSTIANKVVEKELATNLDDLVRTTQVLTDREEPVEGSCC